jgi:hypothetical protein
VVVKNLPHRLSTLDGCARQDSIHGFCLDEKQGALCTHVDRLPVDQATVFKSAGTLKRKVGLWICPRDQFCWVLPQTLGCWKVRSPAKLCIQSFYSVCMLDLKLSRCKTAFACAACASSWQVTSPLSSGCDARTVGRRRPQLSLHRPKETAAGRDETTTAGHQLHVLPRQLPEAWWH